MMNISIWGSMYLKISFIINHFVMKFGQLIDSWARIGKIFRNILHDLEDSILNQGHSHFTQLQH